MSIRPSIQTRLVNFLKSRAQGQVKWILSCHSDQERSKSQRTSKSHQWFKSYGHFTEGVDLPIGGVVSGMVCACSLSSRLVFMETETILVIQPNINSILLKSQRLKISSSPNIKYMSRSFPHLHQASEVSPLHRSGQC